MKKKKRRRRISFFKKNKAIVIMGFVIFLVPLFITVLYAILYKCNIHIIPVEPGDLLSYFGTAFGILGSFVTYRIEVKKREKEKNEELRPFFSVVVSLETDFVKSFRIDIKKLSEKPLAFLYLYDEFVSPQVKESYSFQVTYDQESERKNQGNQYNITCDPDIMDEDGFPKYVQLICDDFQNNTWNCCYYRIKDGENFYYYPRDFELV